MRMLFGKKSPLSFSLQVFLAFGLGLGISAGLGFFNFVLLGKFNRAFIMAASFSVLASLLFIIFLREKSLKGILLSIKKPDTPDYLFLGLVALVSLYAFLYTKIQPYGGWDAWQVWNFKAKFLLLEGNDWRNMFDPVLWRSSQHYPLLLPLINLWGWTFSRMPVHGVPLATSVVFTSLTVGLLCSGLRAFIKTFPSLVSALLIASLPFFLTLGTSQYSDIVLSYYLLGSFLCLLLTGTYQDKRLAFLTGALIGILSFSKGEGAVASALMVLISLIYLYIQGNKTGIFIKAFLVGLGLFLIPSILFYLFYMPPNQTFINGLSSRTHPVHLYRLKIILASLFFEMKSRKWGGIWIAMIIALLLSRGRCFKKQLLVLPTFLLMYGIIVILYYYINTYFKIFWWLGSTMNRMYFTMLPIVLFWSFLAVWWDEKKAG